MTALVAALAPLCLAAAEAGVCGFFPCEPADRLGVTKSADDALQLVLYTCSGDRAIRAARVWAPSEDGSIDTEDDEVLWEVAGRAPRDAITFTVGNSP